MHNRIRLAIWTLIASLTILPTAHADYVTRTYAFDFSDAMPYGESFGSVKVEAYDGNGDAGGGLNAGQVRMTFHAAALPLYGPTDASFGFQQVGFNANVDIKDVQITAPNGWKLRNGRFMGGFGKFAWQAYGDPSALSGPLTLTINDLGQNAFIDNFVVGSMTSTGDWPLFGSVYFAARIGGFDLNDDWYDLSSHVAGVSAFPLIEIDDPIPVEDGGATNESPTPNPEPATLLMGLVGAAGAFGVRRGLHFLRL